MKTKDFRQMTNEELNEKLKSLKVELFNLRFSHATGGLKNPVALNTKENMAKRHIKKNAEHHSIIREMQIKKTIKYHWASIKS